MIIHQNLNFHTAVAKSIVTMGSFDGVHQGHRKILERVVASAHEMGGESVLITFDRHPARVLNNRKEPLHLLTTPEERRFIFESIGIDHLVCLTFDEKLAAMEPEAFISTVFVETLKAVKVITGYGHRFGKGGRGDFDLLNTQAAIHGFETEEIPRQDVEENMISSTRIRHHLNAGEVDFASRLLGYDYMLSGEVTTGSRKGREIGFPTANILVGHPEKLIPADGVYAVRGRIGERTFDGMMNIGFRPTFNGRERTLEVHLFGMNEDIYGATITLTFIAKIRDEKRFDSPEALKEQLNHDKKDAVEMLCL